MTVHRAERTTDVAAFIGQTVSISCHTGTVREASHSTITGHWGIAFELAVGGKTEFLGVMYGENLLVHTSTA